MTRTKLDREWILDHLGGDREVLVEMTKIFLALWPREVERIHESVARRDGYELMHVAHQLRGSLGHFGAATASRILETLEAMGRSGNVGDAEAVLRDFDGEMRVLLPELSSLAEDLSAMEQS
jgi:two-component system sensor histidine kinase/response regulator